MKLKIRKTDTLFSNFIRDRDNWTCQRKKTLERLNKLLNKVNKNPIKAYEVSEAELKKLLKLR